MRIDEDLNYSNYTCRKFWVECNGKQYTCYISPHQQALVVTGYVINNSTNHKEVSDLLSSKISIACYNYMYNSN